MLFLGEDWCTYARYTCNKQGNLVKETTENNIVRLDLKYTLHVRMLGIITSTL